MKTLFFIFLSLFSFSLQGQLIYFSTGQSLYELDLSTCTYDFVISHSIGVGDITFDSKGELYGIVGLGKLFHINTVNGQMTLISTLDTAVYNAMTTSADDIIYAAGLGGELNSFNLNTHEEIYHGNIGYGAAGDLTFYKGDLYMSATMDRLIKVNIQNPSASELVFPYNSSSPILGIVSEFKGCNEVDCYAMSADSSSIYRINFEEKKLDLVCKITLPIAGGASTSEFYSSTIVSILDLNITPANCNKANGSIEIKDASGYGELYFSLNDSPFDSSVLFSDLNEGPYKLIIRDELGCTDTTYVEVGRAVTLNVDTVEALNASCAVNNGELLIQASGGLGFIRYSIDGIVYQDSPLFRDLSPGVYMVWIIDSSKCMAWKEVVIETTANSNILSVLTDSEHCDKRDGRLEVLVDQSAGASYSLDGINFQQSPVFENLAGGNYFVTLLDNNNCTDTLYVEISSVSAPALTISELEPEICDQGNGIIHLVAVNGHSPYSYSLNGSVEQASGYFNFLNMGSYSAAVIDASGCMDTIHAVIPEVTAPKIITLLIHSTSCFKQDGAIEMILEDDDSISMFLTNSQGIEFNSFQNLPSGIYQLKMFNAQGCATDTNFTILSGECDLYIPNVFSPNDDGINDDFKIIVPVHADILIEAFSVFDRWGTQVYFEGNVPGSSISWNGKFNGKELPSAVYTYQIRYKRNSAEAKQQSGVITMIK